MSGESEKPRDAPNPAFGCESFSEVEAKAREVLREKGFTDDQIEAQLGRTKRDHLDWWPTPDAVENPSRARNVR